MPTVPVPDLKEKFRLLRTYTARSTWPLLAQAFGASHKTLQYWGQGSSVREPSLLPESAVPILTRLIAEMLPPGRSPDEVRRLVFGGARRLEEEVRSGSAALISSIIASEGRFDTAILVRADDLSLVEVDTPPDQVLPTVTAGTPFRIEYPQRHGCGYAIALQNTQHAWAVLPCEPASASPSRFLVPGLQSTGSPAFMRERRDLGIHRFVCLQAGEPFPAALDEHRREGTTLDKQGLEAMAAFYQALSASSRACHVLVLSVEPKRA